MDDEQVPTATLVANVVDANGKPILTNSLMDVLISAEVFLPQGEELMGQSLDDNGNVVG